jgi:hypothetical protein
MKKQFLLSLILTLFGGIIYGQNLIRVNNNAGADADYATLQAANDNASDGDTIYMEGSTTAYGDADISKKLTIIGPGYFLSENDSTQANSLEAKIGQIKFNAGSAGSVITGIVSDNYIYIYVDNIALTRCKLNSIFFNADIDNILVLQNYVNNILSVSGKITNGIISNNIVANQISCSSTSGPLQITNNVITYVTGGYVPINVYNSSIANNITCNSTNKINENTGNTITNNIIAAAGTNANGNQYNVVMTNVFVDFNSTLGYSTDGKWQLKTGSPAIGAGVSGVNCGVFGGVSPYVLSGVPNLPHIYQATIAGTAYSDAGLSCTIKIKSGK